MFKTLHNKFVSFVVVFVVLDTLEIARTNIIAKINGFNPCQNDIVSVNLVG